MNETRYMISDAAKKLHVEAHVLRYWEDELEMEIPRTELGHRYYTDRHLLLFERIKQLKEAGYQLKAIKLILPKLDRLDPEEFSFLSLVSEEMNRLAAELCGEEQSQKEPETQQTACRETQTTEDLQETEKENTALSQSLPSNVIPMNRGPEQLSQEERLKQFQTVMTNAMSGALQLQAQQFGTLLSDQISEKLLTQLDCLLRLRQEQEEARFQQLDETIRSHQKSLQEAAAGRAPSSRRKRRR